MNAHLNHAPQSKENPKKPAGQESAVSMPSQVLVRAQLEMTKPGDSDELEADAAADSIVKEGKIARAVSGGHSGGGIALPSQMGSQLSSMQGHGSQLYGNLKTQMESGFGRDFSDVRLHTGDAAAEMSESISARAFTYGNDIFFNRGQFNPGTTDGQHLIAHELTHTIQNSGLVAREPDGKKKDKKKETKPKEKKPKKPKETAEERAVRKKREAEEKFKKEQDVRINNEKEIRKSLVKSPEVAGFTSRYITISKNQENGLGLIDTVLANCQSMMEQYSVGWKKHSPELKQQIVQAMYNTLTQVAAAMDILVEDKLVNPQKENGVLAPTEWIKTRDTFAEVLNGLAKQAHNPAIAELLYEGTYYRSDYNSIIREATSDAAKNNSTAGINKYGAVCNNAAYGSIVAADAMYQFSDKHSNKKDHSNSARISGLKGSDRLQWSLFNIQGKGYGDNGLEGAQQGDAVVFWNLSEKWIKDTTLEAFDEWIQQTLIVPKNANQSTLAPTQNVDQKALTATKIQELRVWATTSGRTKKDRRDLLIEFADNKYTDPNNQNYTVLDDLVKKLNINASHIEIIVGVRNGGKEFLLSGAHDSSKANGIARKNGSLDWKNASGVRDNRIMRRIPIQRNSNFVSVDISSMQYVNQTYTDIATDEYAEPGLSPVDNKTPLTMRSVFENSLDSVTINWLSNDGAIGDVENFDEAKPAEQAVSTEQGDLSIEDDLFDDTYKIGDDPDDEHAYLERIDPANRPIPRLEPTDTSTVIDI